MKKHTRFRDIPQFTSVGNWECDFSIEYFVEQFKRYIEDENLILNPDFQRGHVWTEKQQIAFIEFFLRGGKTGRVIYLNNPCFRYQVEKDEYSEFVCVDGLQRITAIQRFVNNEIKVYGSYFKEYTDSTRIATQTMRININDLQTRKEVLRWYLEMNSGGIVHTDEEIEKVQRLLENEEKQTD